MHVPERLRSCVSVNPGAVNPEAAAETILHPEIIAHRHLAAAAPPFRGDPFGPIRHHYMVQYVAPPKAQRRTIGNFRDRFDWFGACKQPQWPVWSVILFRFPGIARAFVPVRLRRYSNGFAFRNVRVTGLQREHPIGSKPRGKPVRKLMNFALMIFRLKLAAFIFYRLKKTGREADQVKAETGIQGIDKAVEPFAKQTFDNVAIARSFSGFHGKAPHLPIGPEEAGLESPRAFAGPFQTRSQIGGEQVKRAGNRAVAHHRVGKRMFGDDIGHKGAWRDRTFRLAQQAIQRKNEFAAEAGPQFCTSAPRHLSYGL